MSRSLRSFVFGKDRELAVSRRIASMTGGLGYWAAMDYKANRHRLASEAGKVAEIVESQETEEDS